jgi:hypothetical protein
MKAMMTSGIVTRRPNRQPQPSDAKVPMKRVPRRYVAEFMLFACEIATAECSGWESFKKVTELLMTVVIPNPAKSEAVMVSAGGWKRTNATTPKMKIAIPTQEVV